MKVLKYAQPPHPPSTSQPSSTDEQMMPNLALSIYSTFYIENQPEQLDIPTP
jgi:hypothetical protein